MDCTVSGIQLMSLMDGELPSEQAQEMTRHLEECEACAHQVRFWRTVAQWMVEAPVPLPIDLATRVRRAVAEAPDVPRWECEQVRPLLDALAHGELDGVPRAAVEVHCLFCTDCQTAYSMMLDQVVLAQYLPPVDVPSDLKDRIAAAVAAEQVHWWDRVRERLAPWLQWRPVPVGLAAAAALALLWMGIRTTSPPPSPHPSTIRSSTVARVPSTSSTVEGTEEATSRPSPEPATEVVDSAASEESANPVSAPELASPTHPATSEVRIARAATSSASGRARNRTTASSGKATAKPRAATPSPSRPKEAGTSSSKEPKPATSESAVARRERGESEATSARPAAPESAPSTGIVPVARTTTEENPDTKLMDVDYRPPVRGFMAPSLAGDTPEPAPSMGGDSSLIATAEETEPAGSTSAGAAIARNETATIPVSPSERASDPLSGTKRMLRSRTATDFSGPGHFERDESRLVKVEVVRMKF